MSTKACCRLYFKGASHPGVLARVGQIFGERGVSISQMIALDDGPRGGAIIILRFTARAELQTFFARRLSRMPEVDEIELLPDIHDKVWDYIE